MRSVMNFGSRFVNAAAPFVIIEKAKQAETMLTITHDGSATKYQGEIWYARNNTTKNMPHARRKTL